MFSLGILRNPRNLRNPQAIPQNPGHLKFGWDTCQILEEFPQVSTDIPRDSSRNSIPWSHSRGILKEPYSLGVFLRNPRGRSVERLQVVYSLLDYIKIITTSKN